jgi:hypothetical protein
VMMGSALAPDVMNIEFACVPGSESNSASMPADGTYGKPRQGSPSSSSEKLL